MQFNNVLENGDIGDPMKWLEYHFADKIAVGNGHSITATWNKDELDRVRDMIEREHKPEPAEGDDNTKPPCTENCTSCLDTGCIFHETNRDTDEYKELSRELRSRIASIE